MFSFISIKDYHDQLANSSVTCLEAVDHYLEGIENKKHLNAFVEVFREEAMAKARELHRKGIEGVPFKKLHGVVIAIKDNLCYKGHRVTAASKILEGFESLFTATAVQRLINEDAIIIGRCNCDEFAMGSTNENSVYGRVLNGLDESKIPGGSSGGSAVAVQAGLCMASLGSDTGGSVRQPAGFCGIIGLKPSYGSISRHGLIAFASSFDQVGIFGNTVRDVSLLLDIMKGADEFDSTLIPGSDFTDNTKAPKKKYRIGYFPEALDHSLLDGEIKQAFFNLGGKLKDEGTSVEPVSFELLDYIVPTYYVLTTAEASSNLNRYDGVRFGYRSASSYNNLTEFYKYTRSEGFGKEVKRRIMLGTFVLSTGYYDAYFTKAQQMRRLLVDKTETVFSEYDALILPVSLTTAFDFGHESKDPIAMYLGDIFTVFANLTGIPAISLPLFKHSNGMPFGLQIMTKRTNELTLLEISEMLMDMNMTNPNKLI